MPNLSLGCCGNNGIRETLSMGRVLSNCMTSDSWRWDKGYHLSPHLDLTRVCGSCATGSLRVYGKRIHYASRSRTRVFYFFGEIVKGVYTGELKN